jgi:hypothetical protein
MVVNTRPQRCVYVGAFLGATAVPRTILKGGSKVKHQRTKTDVTQTSIAAAVAASGEDERRLIQKTKNRFRHFIFTETSPAISPAELVRKALTVVPGIYRVGTSYVLYAHDTSCAEECSHIRTPLGPGIHYHLLMRSADPALETMLIKKTAASFVYVENSFYQVLVQCPLTTYYELYARQSTSLLEKVGGEIFDLFERVLQRDVLKPLTRINNEPIWEAHKYSQILAQEQLIALVNIGPYRSVLSQMLGTLVEKAGSVSFEQHGWHLSLECGPTLSQYPGDVYTTSGVETPTTTSTEYEYTDPRQDDLHLIPANPEQVTYSTAGLMGYDDDADYSYDYVEGYNTTRATGYDLAEDLLREPTPEEALDAVFRTFSKPYGVEEEEGIPKPSTSSVDFQ